MNSPIKTIFKVLIGTAVLICGASLLVEYMNVSTTSLFMKGILTRSITKSCDYFVQETYKQEGIGDSIANNGNAVDITSIENEVAISGGFFKGNSPREVYDNLYKNNTFKDFMNTNLFTYYTGEGSISSTRTNMTGIWKNLDMLNYGLFGIRNGLSSEEEELGKNYSDTMTSASNLGIVYLDDEVLNRIAKWNLVANLAEGKKANIHTGTTSDKNYVTYKGFRIYYNTFKVSDIEYTIYDRGTASGRNELEKKTNITSDYMNGVVTSESRNICVADIEYTIDIGYVGITPLRKVVLFAVKGGVKGMDNDPREDMTSQFQNYNYSSRFDSKSAETADIPLKGNITYYIIR